MEENNQIPSVHHNTFMSDSIAHISSALSAFQGEISQPKLNKEVSVRTKTGGSYKFKYADLGECMKAAAPGLKKNGLAVSQMIADGFLVTILLHTSGEWLTSTLALGYEKLDSFQSLGSAITYLKRYSYCAILGIVADTDDDGNLADGNTADIKDRKGKGALQAAFTGAQLKQAFGEVSAATSENECQEVWKKWANDCPALCQNGTEFYNAVANKMSQLRNQQNDTIQAITCNVR